MHWRQSVHLESDFLMVGFINGIAMGAGVVIARYYGAKKETVCKRQSIQRLHLDLWPGLR